MDFDSIVLCSKFPLPVKAMKKGLCVRIKSAIVTPKKNVNIDGIEIYNNKKVDVEYVLFPEAFSNKIGGDIQKSPDPIPFQIVDQTENELIFISPKKKGAYRLFAFVKNDKGQSSVANIPFLIE